MAPAQTMKATTPFFVALTLIAGTLAIYLPACRYPFVNLDDPGYVYRNLNLREGLSWEGLRWAFTSLDYQYNWHPLTWISHMLDVELFRFQAESHHTTSVLLHLLNGFLLLGALRALGIGYWAATFVAALFLWHPLRVESVAWIAERKDVLAGTFWMLGLSSYARYCRAPSRLRYSTVCLMLILGLMSKSMVVTLPFVFLLLDFWPLRRRGFSEPSPTHPGTTVPQRSGHALIREKVPMFFIVAVVCAVTLISQTEGGAVSAKVSMLQRLMHVPIAYFHYVVTFFWPAGLSVFYPHPAIVDPEGVHPGLAIVTGLALILVSTGLWRLRASRPALATGWFWFLVTLLPVIGLIQVGDQGVADRYMYLPGIGLSLALLAIPHTFSRLRKKVVLVTAAGVWLLCLIAAAHSQVQFWRNSDSLWRHALEVTDDNYVAHLNLGQGFRLDQLDEAMQHFEEAIRIAPDLYPAYVNLGKGHLKKNELEEARQILERGVAVRPEESLARLYLSVAFVYMEMLDEARLELETIEKLDPAMTRNRLFQKMQRVAGAEK